MELNINRIVSQYLGDSKLHLVHKELEGRTTTCKCGHIVHVDIPAERWGHFLYVYADDEDYQHECHNICWNCEKRLEQYTDSEKDLEENDFILKDK